MSRFFFGGGEVREKAREGFTREEGDRGGWGALEVGKEVRAKVTWLRNAPVVDVAQGILNESLVFVVTPLPVHDEFVLVVPWGQIAHHRENLRTRRRGLRSHGYRLQPVGERPAKVHLCVRSFRR